MELSRRNFLSLSAIAAATLLAGCSSTEEESIKEVLEESNEASMKLTGALALDSAAWNHDEDNDVFWQLGIQYCETPEAPEYETLGIFVPGPYFSAEDNGDGTYTCTIGEGSLSGFSAQSAPIVMPINTAGYSAQDALTQYNYDSISEYLKAGFVYVHAGCRGRENGYDEDGNLTFSGGAPWGVTDLKAAVRYLRYNTLLIPGDTNNIFTFGHSGGGAQSAIMGASGNSDLYLPYLESIGAAMTDSNGNELGDNIAGAICWCPITCLDQANAAYEWMMGQYASSGTREDGVWTAALSDHLAQRFAEYINDAAFTDSEGNILELEDSSEGVFAKGSYYDYVVGLVNESLNNFLNDTEFPYTPSSDAMPGDGGMAKGPSGEKPQGDMPSGEKPSEDTTPENAANEKSPDEESRDSEDASSEGSEASKDESSNKEEAAKGSADDSSQTAYETVEDYIAALNEDEKWVAYDSKSKTASITSLESFVQHCKKASKDVGAFDKLDRSSSENILFGNDENDALHFDTWMTELLQANSGEYSKLDGWDDAYVADYSDDVQLTDTMGTDISERSAMYNPLYYVCDAYDGMGTSTVAPHWRIHSGIEQGDTSLTTEANLALALQSNSNVDDVEFMAVWDQGHTMAERTGDATENSIAWIKSLLIS